MGKANQVTAIFCLVLGLAVIYGSYRVGYGMLSQPGPGFLSFWCGIALSGLSLLVFAQGRLAQRRGDGGSLRQLWAGMKWPKGVYVVLALILYTLTSSSLGFSLSTMVLLVFLFKAIQPQKWSVALGGALITSLLSFVVFARLLDVQLPRGILEKLLF
jgi:putative tricarboxylic transport membrane protein